MATPTRQTGAQALFYAPIQYLFKFRATGTFAPKNKKIYKNQSNINYGMVLA
jgi:hypothetical protein